MAIKVVLLDIEGTVCSISFVKDVLFPYALRALPTTLATEWENPQFLPYRNAFPPEHSSSPAAIEAHVRDLMAQDLKISYMKALQGYLWQEGYHRGEIKAPLFGDVAGAIQRWTSRGLKVMIYSSGSVPAQKLLFGHTDAQPSDLTANITGWFDTVNAGPKTDAGSYAKITASYPEVGVPSNWLFLSDNVREVAAAKEAGMQSCAVVRPGNPVLSEEDKERHGFIQSFEEAEELLA